MRRDTIMIVACEQSGDNYGSLLARELKAKDPTLDLVGIGGPLMEQEGVTLLENMIDHSATGLIEVLGSARFFLRTMRRVVEYARDHNARAVVMIDSPDFNLRIAPKLKQAGIPTVYYISPQLWAWRSGRIKKIKRYIDRMLVIFPFEVDWYRQHNYEATFVGHPMLDLFDLESTRSGAASLKQELTSGQAPLIGLLPGSRKNEISRLLPEFLGAAEQLRQTTPDARFALGCAHWLTEERARSFLAPHENLGVTPIFGNTHQLMAASDVLLACSGTATLEAALLGTPLVMAYKFSPLTYTLANMLIDRSQFFCMPNRILNKAIAPELFQREANPTTLAQHARRLLGEDKNEARSAFAKLEHLLGGPGASSRAANEILALTSKP